MQHYDDIGLGKKIFVSDSVSDAKIQRMGTAGMASCDADIGNRQVPRQLLSSQKWCAFLLAFCDVLQGESVLHDGPLATEDISLAHHEAVCMSRCMVKSHD